MDQDKSVESGFPAIIQTAKQSEEVIAEIGNSVVDLVLDSEVLEKVPVFSWVVKIYGVIDKYKKNKFKRNVYFFLKAISNSKKEKVEELAKKLLEDNNSEEFVDTTLSILLESNKPLKSMIVGNLMSALIDKQISFDDFNDLSLIIHAASVPALEAIPSHIDKYGYNASCRDTRIEGLLSSIGVCARYGTHLTINELGKKLYQYGFQDKNI